MQAGVYGGRGAAGEDGEYYAAAGVDEAAPAVAQVGIACGESCVFAAEGIL